MLNAAGALPPDGANWSPNVTAAVPASHGTQPVPDAAERVSAFADAIVQALGADGRLNTASLTGKYGPRVLTAADLLAILAENKQLRADAGEDVRAVAEACAGVVDGTPPQPIRHEYAVRRLRDRFADRIAEFRERDPEFKAERERDNNRCPCGCPKTGPGCDCHWCNEPTNAEAERDGDRHEGGNDA
jgi:hypothetical protein